MENVLGVFLLLGFFKHVVLKQGGCFIGSRGWTPLD